MKANRIIIGDVTAPILQFENAQILEIRETTSVSMVGAELAIDQFVPVVKYDLYIRYQFVPADLENYQRFLTKEGLVMCGYYNYDIRAIPYGTPVRFYIDTRPAGLYYLSKVDRLTKDSFKLSCVSAIGLMDKQRHVGNVYQGETFETVAAEIMGEGYEYIIEPDVASVQVYGWLPYGTKRSNLHQLLVAFGVTITKADTGGMLFTFLKATEGYKIELDRVYDEGNVIYGDAASRVEILEHGFFYFPGQPEEVLYDTKGEYVENTVVVFEKPIWADSIYVEEGGSMQILERGVNYAVVVGSGVLIGKPYGHTTKQIVAENPDAAIEKIVTVEDATLITLANAENALKRISEYYFHATTVKNAIVLNDERAGRRYTFQNPFREFTSAFLANVEAYTSNKTKAECEFIQDYVPLAQGSSFLRRVILPLTPGGAVWEIPDSVFEKDVPQIRAVLIGAGYDGQDGQNGQDGYTGDSLDGGLGGEGGLGGQGGKGGRILSATIDCTNLKSIRYGSQGKNTWVQAGGKMYDSSFGVSSQSGFVDMFTGAVYALPGTPGVPAAAGGRGGSYRPIAQVNTADTRSADGESLEIDGVKYKGGKRSDRTTVAGDYLGMSENLTVYVGGLGGGGAAYGSDGKDATGGLDWSEKPPTPNSEWVFPHGGDGGDGKNAFPTLEMYGSGGNGGSGGGGGGGACNIHSWNHAYNILIWVGGTVGVNTTEKIPPGKGGKGGKGTVGYPGCLIIYF